VPIWVQKAGSPVTVKFSTPQEIVIDKDNGSITVFQPTHDDLNANANIQIGNVDIADANPVPVKAVPGTLTDRSITATGASQTAAVANTSRQYLFMQNISNGEIWFNFTTAATTDTPSIKLPKDSSFTMEGLFVSTEALNVIRNTGNGKLVVKEG